MSLINVVAKMSDLPVEKAKTESAPAESGFDQVMQTATGGSDANAANTACAVCAAATPAPVAPATAEVAAAPEAEINRSAMYRFTVFVRVSGDMGALSQTLVEEFKALTSGFVGELLNEKEAGVDVLDSYLSQAESSVSKGLASSKSLIDNMISAADYGLKATIASMTGSSWMSSLGGGSSSGLTSVSMADIAKIYLQDSVNNAATGSPSAAVGSSAAGAVSYGGGYQLQMVKGATEPIKIVPENSGAESATAAKAAVVSRKDQILEKFLQLIDDISGAIGGKVVKAGYSVSYYNSALSRDMEVEEPAGSVEAAEEVVI